MRVGLSDAVTGTAQGGEAPPPRLISAAHEFEGQMLKELLKPMTAGDDGQTGSDGDTGILGEFASEALGKALSQQGGFGIANRIIGQLSRSGNQAATESVTGMGHFNTGMSSLK
jgi:Rod binding domain-containing protein